MARKKRTIIDEDLNEPVEVQGSGSDVLPEDIEDLEALQEATSHLGPSTEVRVKVVKLEQHGARHCFTVDAETLNEDYISEQFGPGEYSLKIYVNRKYVRTHRLGIAERLRPAENGGGGNSDSIHVRMLEKQLEFNQSLLTSILRAGSPQHTPVNELAQAVQALHGMSGGNGQSPSAMEKVLEAFMKGLDVGQKNMNPSDWKTDLVAVAKEALPGIATIMSQPRNGAKQPTAANPNPSLAGGEVDAILYQGIQYLKRKCISGVDPELLLEWIGSNADEYRPILERAAKLDFASFCAIDPEIGSEPYVQFFKSLYDGLRATISGADSVVEDTSGAGGDAGDPPAHATFGH